MSHGARNSFPDIIRSYTKSLRRCHGDEQLLHTRQAGKGVCVCFNAAINRGGRLRSAAVPSAFPKLPDEKNPQEVANASEKVGAARGGAEPEHQNHHGTESATS